MNLKYWGIQLPLTDSINEPGTALPVIAFGGAMSLKSLGTSPNEVLEPTDSSAKTLTIPAGAIYARVQVNGSALWYTLDGSTPVIASGHGYKVADLTIIDLWGPDAIAKFKCLAHTSGTPKVWVEYFGYVKDIVAISEA